MKASVKLRDGDRPLVSAKLPLSFLGVPIASGMAMGSSRDLSFHLGTLFQSGPSCRITYRPGAGDEVPLSLLVKAGFGAWGSPLEAPLVMAAEFKLSSKGTPSFAVQVRPRAGNFSVRKNVVPSPAAVNSSSSDGQDQLQVSMLGSSKENPCASVGGGSVVEGMPRTPEKLSLDMAGFKVGSPPSSEGSSIVMVEDVEEDHEHHRHHQEAQVQRHDEGCLKTSASSACLDEPSFEDHPANFLHAKTGGVPARATKENGNYWSLVAHTALPLGRHALASVRWRVKMDADVLKSFHSETDIFSLKKLPVLVVDKLSFKSVENDPKMPRSTLPNASSPGLIKELEHPELGKVANLCSSLKQQLHLLHAENEFLKKTMEEMKAELGGGKSSRKKSPSYVVDKEMQRQVSGDHQKHRGRGYGKQHQHDNKMKQKPPPDKLDKSGKDHELELLTTQLEFELNKSKDNGATGK